MSPSEPTVTASTPLALILTPVLPSTVIFPVEVVILELVAASILTEPEVSIVTPPVPALTSTPPAALEASILTASAAASPP